MSNTVHTRPSSSPVRAAAAGTGVDVEFEDVTYTVPPSAEWDLDAIEAAEEGRAVMSTRLILGAEQWAEFRKHHRTFGDLERFMSAVQEVVGGNPQ